MSEPVAIEPARVRARRSPRAVLYLWAWELVVALGVAAPLYTWSGQVFGARPDGDASVFRPGGLDLVMWVLDDGPGLAIAVRTTIILLVLATIFGQLVAGALLGALALRDADGRPIAIASALRVGAASFLPLLAVSAAAVALQASAVAGAGALAFSIERGLRPSLGDAGSSAWAAALVGGAVVVALAIGVLADLARAAIVRGVIAGERGRAAARAALRALPLRRFGHAFGAWAWRAALAAALVVLGGAAGDWTGARAGGALWLLFFGHQAIVLARAALRASWLADALRRVSATP